MTATANQIRVSQLPYSIEVYATTDLTDLLAPESLLARVEIGDDEPREHATARVMIAAASAILEREQ